MASSSVNTVELARLGPIAYQVKRKVKPADWSKLVKIAHARGFSINSFLDSSLPNPLKERTSESLRAQAQRTMNDVYAPAEKTLSDREQQVRNIDALRAQDEKYYTDWLNAKHGQLQEHAKAADDQLLAAQKTIQDQQSAAMAALRPGLIQQANSRPGNVVDNSNATAFDLAPDQARNLGMIANERARTQEQVGTNQQHMADVEANNFAYMASLTARRQADTWKELQNVADDKGKLVLQKGADAAKEVARLLDEEIQKAQNNRDYQALADKLGIQADQLNLDVLHEKHRHGEAASKLSETIRHNQEMEGLRNTANQISQGQLDVAWYKAKHPGRGKGTGSADPQQRFDAAYAALSSSERTVRKDGTPIYFDRDYVAKHRALVKAQIQKAMKLTPKMADAVIEAFLRRGGSAEDPGDYKQYVRTDIPSEKK